MSSNYLTKDQYKLLGKEDATVSFGYIATPLKPNKNVRLRIYYHNDLQIINKPNIIKYNEIKNNQVDVIGRQKNLFFDES